MYTVYNRAHTFPHVCVDAHVSSGPGQILVFSICDVFVRGRIDEFLGEAKVDYVNYMVLLGGMSANQKVFWLHVTKYKVLRMDVFHASNLQTNINNIQKRINTGLQTPDLIFISGLVAQQHP